MNQRFTIDVTRTRDMMGLDVRLSSLLLPPPGRTYAGALTSLRYGHPFEVSREDALQVAQALAQDLARRLAQPSLPF